MARSSSGGARAGQRYERVFVVRLWEEAGASPRDGTRGSVHELESGQRFFFSGLRDLHDFLTLRLAAFKRGATGTAKE